MEELALAGTPIPLAIDGLERQTKQTKNFMKSIEWAAGLFEGEGCITYCGKKPRIKMRLTDYDVLEAFANVFGTVDRIKSYDFPSRKSHWKKCWDWEIYRKADVRRILIAMLPYFGNRRAYKALNILDSLEID